MSVAGRNSERAMYCSTECVLRKSEFHRGECSVTGTRKLELVLLLLVHCHVSLPIE
jgi:hypothetical protein